MKKRDEGILAIMFGSMMTLAGTAILASSQIENKVLPVYLLPLGIVLTSLGVNRLYG